MQPQPLDFVLVVSIAPIEFYLQLQSGAYRLAAAPAKPGEVNEETGLPYTFLKIYDADIGQVDSYERAKPQLVPRRSDCRDIAMDFMKLMIWSAPGASSSGAHWGVGMLKDMNSEEVTEEFLASLVTSQRAMCSQLIRGAEFFAEQKKYGEIGPQHRAAAIWMGNEEAPWLRRDYFNANAESAKETTAQIQTLAASVGSLAKSIEKFVKAST